jgi:hypothetical protein
MLSLSLSLPLLVVRREEKEGRASVVARFFLSLPLFVLFLGSFFSTTLTYVSLSSSLSSPSIRSQVVSVDAREREERRRSS